MAADIFLSAIRARFLSCLLSRRSHQNPPQNVNTDLQILHLEDNPADALLIHAMLEQNGLVGEINWVQNREAYVSALEDTQPDLIISDFSLPAFNGLKALEMAREKKPEVPFLFVSGTLGEEVAVNAMQSGATDYVIKDRLARLVPAVRRAISGAMERQALQRAEAAMIQSEFKYRQLFECLGEAALLADAKSGRVLDSNRQAEILFRRIRAQIVGSNVATLLSPPTLATYQKLVDSNGSWDRATFEGEVLPSEGPAAPVAVSAASIILYNRQLVLGLYRDISGRHQVRAEIHRLREKVDQFQADQPSEVDQPMETVQSSLAAIEEALKTQWQISVPSLEQE